MSGWKFGRLSEERLKMLHPDLETVLRAALPHSPFDFGIGKSSIRTIEEQKRLVAEGRSRTMNSRHIPRVPINPSIYGFSIPQAVSHAADLLVYRAPGELSWEAADFTRVAEVVKRVAGEKGVTIEWGGDWRSFFDGPHFQLPWAFYPVRASLA